LGGVPPRRREFCELDDERVLVLAHFAGRGKASGLDVGHIRPTAGSVFHPITHPPKTRKIVLGAASLAWVPTTSNMTAQTIPQPIV
jgi:hypothetical protein